MINKDNYPELLRRAEDYATRERQRRTSNSQPLEPWPQIRYMVAALLISAGLWGLIVWGAVAVWRMFQ